MSMMKRIRSVIGQLMASLAAEVGYFRSARAFFTSASLYPLSSVGPIFRMTLSGDVAGRSLDVNDSPDFVRKSFARSQSENFDHGPTKMWNWHSFAWTEIGFVLAKVSSPGFT